MLEAAPTRCWRGPPGVGASGLAAPRGCSSPAPLQEVPQPRAECWVCTKPPSTALPSVSAAAVGTDLGSVPCSAGGFGGVGPQPARVKGNVPAAGSVSRVAYRSDIPLRHLLAFLWRKCPSPHESFLWSHARRGACCVRLGSLGSLLPAPYAQRPGPECLSQGPALLPALLFPALSDLLSLSPVFPPPGDRSSSRQTPTATTGPCERTTPGPRTTATWRLKCRCPSTS